MQVIKQNTALNNSRAAGILLLLSLLVPILNWGLVLSNFISPGIETSLTILDNELLFRLNIFTGIFSAKIILALNICLYRMLRNVNRSLIIYDSMAILFPWYAGILSIKLLGRVPVSLFQILFGCGFHLTELKQENIHKK